MTRVLVLEGAEKERRRLSVELFLRGYEVLALHDPRDAFVLLEQEPDVDLVIVESGQPDFDGERLARRLRAAFTHLAIAEYDGVRLSTSLDHLTGLRTQAVSSSLDSLHAMV